MDRYRILYGMVEDWMKQVPWLQPPTQPRTRASSSRSKVTTRGAVAKGLNDVVQFQEEIWKKALCGPEKIPLDLDFTDECDGTEDGRATPAAPLDDDNESDFGSVTSASASVVTTASSVTKRRSLVSSREASAELTYRPIKKRKTRHNRSVESASRFLLNPSDTPIKPQNSTKDNQLLSHLISSDASPLAHTFVHPPTRLQLLHATRPGGSDAIVDEELFEEGELEALFRTEEEVGVLVRLVDWDEVEEEKRLNAVLRTSRNRSTKSKQRTSQENPSPQRGTGRINMDAFKRLMDQTSDLDDFVVGCREVDKPTPGVGGEDEEGDYYDWLFNSPTPTLDTPSRPPIHARPTRPSPIWDLDARLGGIEEEEDWRPMSPDHSGMGLGLYHSADHYDL